MLGGMASLSAAVRRCPPARISVAPEEPVGTAHNERLHLPWREDWHI